MPDDDWSLGQNEVDVRNEASKAAFARDIADVVAHLRHLNETLAINDDAEQRRQESITRTLDEIQRLMDG